MGQVFAPRLWLPASCFALPPTSYLLRPVNICISYIHVGQGRYKSHPLLTEEALLTAIPKALRGADSGLRGPKPYSRYHTQ